jgi:hypothetical protein
LSVADGRHISQDDVTLCLYIAAIAMPEARSQGLRVAAALPIDPEKTVEA